MVQEGIASPFRALFRMSLPNDTQRALGTQCGDRYILPGDYRDFDKVIDHACETGLPEADITAAADALRANPEALRTLRLRVADIETRLADLTGNNRDVFEGYLQIAKRD